MTTNLLWGNRDLPGWLKYRWVCFIMWVCEEVDLSEDDQVKSAKSSGLRPSSPPGSCGARRRPLRSSLGWGGGRGWWGSSRRRAGWGRTTPSRCSSRAESTAWTTARWCSAGCFLTRTKDNVLQWQEHLQQLFLGQSVVQRAAVTSSELQRAAVLCLTSRRRCSPTAQSAASDLTGTFWPLNIYVFKWFITCRFVQNKKNVEQQHFFPFLYFSFYLRLLNQNISDYRIKYRVYLWDQHTNWNNFSSFHTCSFLLAASKMRIHVLFSTFGFYPGLCRREWSSEFSRRRSLWGAAFRLLSPWTRSPSCRKVYTWQKQSLQVNTGKNIQIHFEQWCVQIQIFYKVKFHFKLEKQIWETNSSFSTEGCLDHFTVWRLKSNVFFNGNWWITDILVDYSVAEWFSPIMIQSKRQKLRDHEMKTSQTKPIINLSNMKSVIFLFLVKSG